MSSASLSYVVGNGRGLARLDVGVLIIIPLVCVVWAIHAGRDMNWDLLNYHLYVPHAFVTNRLAQDFMPASIQSYLNPTAYLPFYWMVKAEWPSVLIGATLALLHSMTLVLLYKISRALFSGGETDSRVFALMATGLGAATPIFWAELGTSFIDISTAIFVLGGVYVLVIAAQRVEATAKLFLIAGVLLGVATGLKLTNAIYVLPAIVFVVSTWSSLTLNITRLTYYSGGVALGSLLTHGYWGYRLYSEFGNPFFPFFNGVFQSPDFQPVSISHERFLPANLFDSLLFPFRMADYAQWIYTETIAPDIRPAIAIGLIAFLLIRFTLGLLRAGRSTVNPVPSPARSSELALPKFGWFVVAAFAMWVATTANGRYAIGILMLLGPFVALAAKSFLPAKHVVGLLVAAVALQFAHFAYAGSSHWTPLSWTRTWFDVTVPARLVSQPFLHLSFGNQSRAFIVPWLHPDSAFVNITGQYSIGTEGPGGGRLTRLLDRFQGATRILIPARPAANSRSSLSRSEVEALVDGAIARLDLRADFSDCERIATGSTQVAGLKRGSSYLTLESCALRPIESVNNLELAQRERATRALNMVEDACPDIFFPRRPVLERGRDVWSRQYLGTDSILGVVNDRVYYWRYREIRQIYLADVDHVLNDKARLECPTAKHNHSVRRSQ